MIINGGSRSNWRFFSAHFMKQENEQVRLAEVRGLAAHDVLEAFREIDAMGSVVRGKNHFYHANLNPQEQEHLTDAQWDKAIDMLEGSLGLEGQPRFVVEHMKEGRTHRHVVWSRVNADTLTLISDSQNYQAHAKTSRAIEREFGLEPTRDIFIEREEKRPERRAKNWEKFRAKTSGLEPENIKAEVTRLWRESDSGKAFAAALKDAGYVLCKGDKRDFCIIDPAGHEHSLARRIEGMKAGQLREFMADIHRDDLPTVSDGREGQRSQPETAKERAAEKQYEHFMAPVHEAVRETGETPLYGMEPTWWERAGGVIGRMADMAVGIAGKALQAAKGLWQDWVGSRPGPERGHDDDLDQERDDDRDGMDR